MSLSSQSGANLTSYEAAGPRGVRPGIETPAPDRFFRRPDLLEGRPVVGRSLRPEQPATVGRLEAVVHLQPAPEGRAGVPPAALEAVDAHERREVRRVRRLPAHKRGLPVPAGSRRPRVADS